jgi:hypothetical protein
MSIINDALKKLQNQITQSNPHTAKENTLSSQMELTPAQQAGFQPILSNEQKPASVQPTKKTKEDNKESSLVLILGILCLLIGLLLPVVNKQSLIHVLLSHIPKKQKSSIAIQSRTPIVIAQPVPEQKQEPAKTLIKNQAAPASKPSSRNQNRIIINGTMTRGEQNLALIDGQIYEEGDEVDGVELIKITPKGVTILENGEQRIIKVLGQ